MLAPLAQSGASGSSRSWAKSAGIAGIAGVCWSLLHKVVLAGICRSLRKIRGLPSWLTCSLLANAARPDVTAPVVTVRSQGGTAAA